MQLRFYVDQLIDVMKIDANKISLNLTKQNMNELIKNIVSEFKIPIFEKNLNVNIYIDEKLELKVDTTRMSQVLSNLLSNAIKFSESYGKIEISSELRKEDCLFKIKDNGIGLTEQEMSKIFGKFVMLNQSTEELSKFGKGSGLGLYIAKGIVEAHGGKIGVKSEGLHKGSEFYFTLPIQI